MNSNPYNETEEKILNHLAEAYNLFITLSEDHPNHHSEFCTSVHQLQRLVMSKALRRNFKNYFDKE